MKLINVFFVIVLMFFTSLVIGQETYLDRFSNVSYSNNNGSSNFSTNWIETGDSNNGPTSQYIRISSNRLEFYYIWQETIRRSVNLNGAATAVLSFNWQAISLTNGRSLGIQVSNNGGASYTTIATINGNNNAGTFSQDISGFISATTTVRFAKSGSNWNNNDYALIDNFQITATFPAPIPVIEVNDVTVDEDGGNAIFAVRHTGTNATAPFAINYQTVNGSATSGNDYTATNGVLNFNGTAGDTETITVPILNDGTIENPENFTIEFILSSDPQVDITDTAEGTIIDDDALIMTDGGSATTCSDTFFDPGGLSNYSNNEDATYTICPDTADTYLNVNFTSFEIVTGDILYVYDGNSTSAPLIGEYDSANVPSSINSSAASGCLTFRFVSNGSSTGAGWEAEINCFPDGPIIVIDDISFDEDVGNAVFTVRSTRAAHGRNIFLLGFVEESFTVDFRTVDGSALAGSDYTASTGTLTFTGELNNVQTISVPIANDGTPEFAENFTIEFTNAEAEYATVNYNDTGTGTINSQILANDPLTLFQEFDGYYDYSTTGGTLRTGANGVDPCAVTNSSSNSLISAVPASASVERAYLYWSHSSTVRDPNVTFEGQNVSANFLYQTSLGNRNFFGYVSDVTTIVQGVSNLSTNVFDFSDLTINNTGDYCNTSTVLGGWALMVFYEDRSLPAVNINLYQGFDGLSNDGTSFTLDSFYAISGTGAKASFLSWEGDPDLNGSSSGSTNPEELSITNQRNQNFVLTGDGGQTGNNSYNSTIYDNTVGPPAYNNANMYGVDLDTYDISSFIQPADSQVTANVDVGQDFVISAAVVLKVPSNLIAGRVFEDVNYPGGEGRDQVTSGGVGLSGAVVELFDSSGTFIQRKNTEANGNYSFGGMADGDYFIKVVSSTVRSSRDNGPNCSSCYPVQTYRSEVESGGIVDILNEVGGANPSAFQDVSLGVINNAQSVSKVEVAGNGVVGVNFGFNFNTIVNTNVTGQGSLHQFITNSNTLGETGLDIESNSIFDPAATEDTSIFMIPITGDPLGRIADANYTNGYFNISLENSNTFPVITGTNTKIDGRTQTAYSGNTNTGTLGSGGTTVGLQNSVLPNYNSPEIQVYRPGGDVLNLNGTNVTVSNISVYANNNAGVIISGGQGTVSHSLLGVNAVGANAGNIDYGVEVIGGDATIDSNFITTNSNAGIQIRGGSSVLVQNNHLTENGTGACFDNIFIDGGNNITITQNLIEKAGALGIEVEDVDDVVVLENTIKTSGQNGGNCSGVIENAGIKIDGNNAAITNNIITSNGGAGIVIAGGNTSGNLISRNSIFANGTTSPALGIDLDAGNAVGDGVTINDNGDADSGPNGLANFAVISNAFVSGSNIIVEGWSRPGATIELFLTDINEGTANTGDNSLGMVTDYGEGQVFIGSMVEGSSSDQFPNTSSYSDDDGNNDTTNKFRFVIPKPASVTVGNFVTTTATISNSTSEFSPFVVLKVFNAITNRNITYRIKGN
ncbi:Calx-beta domain-containing protein [Cellulophaga lytica]|uniref:beta strand repeat-containing protein n=1 Tax=Cellulophaga lytica TaxID=979 RepID=UPI0026E36AC1|nr:Calx-beta domain-containing protein [Cellulophaga lytica]MDO6855291.1 Calx-beta domain-containing protein [Cellulophaga lytica]